MAANSLSELPSEMLSFTLIHPNPASLGPRLGRLLFVKRKAIQTPHYVAVTSRGVVPHISQDMMRKHTAINSVYLGLEDCKLPNPRHIFRNPADISAHWSSLVVEKAPYDVPPVYKLHASPDESPLRQFIALQEDALTVLGPRRVAPVPCPAGNTSTAISILTSVGFRQLESDQYIEAVEKLRPDVVIGIADLVLWQKPGLKRIEKMSDRTHSWTRDIINVLHDIDRDGDTEHRLKPSLFAPILPIEPEQQSFYLNDLHDDVKEHLSGLALYDSSSVRAVPGPLSSYPRLCLNESSNPHAILKDISLGIDILTVPFIATASEGGIALDFSFPASSQESTTPKSLGTDMWSPIHSADLSPLTPDCQCYTCRKHHRAYVQHLLSAKEMLAWTLLQIHNHHVMDRFFAGIRIGITGGTFEEEVKSFGRVYETELPERTGQGPR